MVRAWSLSYALGGFPSSLLCLESFPSSSSRSAKVKGSSPSPCGLLSPQPQKVSDDWTGIGSSSSGLEGVSFVGSRIFNALPAKANLVVSPWLSFIRAKRFSFSTPRSAQRSIPGRGS